YDWPMTGSTETAEVIATLARIPLFAGRPLAQLQVELLASLTNRNYKVSLDGESYVLRIAGEGTEHYIDRAAEARNAGLAASIGLAPELLHLDPQSGLMVTHFIAGAPLRAADLRRPGPLRDAAKLLKRLHASGLVFEGRMELFPKLDQYLALAARRGWPAGLDLTPVRARAEAARAGLERSVAPFVPSHVDPVAHNFVRARNGALYL